MEHRISCCFFRAIPAFFLLLFSIIPLYTQWSLQVSGSHYPMYALYFIDNNTGLLASNSNNLQQLIGGEIIRTTNGGTNWQRVLLDSGLRVKSFYFFNTNTGLAVGGSYASRGFIFRTTNGGINWTDITPVIWPPYIFNVSFINNLTGFAGSSRAVLKTTDGGISWNVILPLMLTSPVWAKVHFFDINTGIYARDSNIVYKTTNSGTNWQTYQVSAVNNLFRDMNFTDNNTGYLSADAGRIYKTTNQGLNWALLNTGIDKNIYSLSFPNAATGYASCLQYVLKTTNSGSSWFKVFDYENQYMYTEYFLNENTGYIAGDSGKVYKTTTGGVIGIKPISNQIPGEFSLYQNYPNPFNPSTIIKFAIAKATNVKISVYDVLGREVEELVNDFITPGTYEMQWNAAGYSSGIYFYKILTNEYTSVKKMSFIK